MNTLNEYRCVQQKQFRIFLFLLFIGVLITSTAVAYGADEGISILQLLQKYEIDSKTGIVQDACRFLGYSIIKGLGALVDGLYKSIEKIYSLLSFGSSKQLIDLVNRYSVLYKSIFIISLVFLGIYLLVGKKKDQLNTVNCILIIAVVVTAMPLFTQKMTTLTVNSAKYVQNQWVETGEKQIQSIASTVLADNLVDLKKVDRNISGKTVKNLKEDKGYNNLKAGTKQWRYINITEPMDPGKMDLNGDFWEKELGENKKTGKTELAKMNSMFSLDTYYYRYQAVSWLNIFALLITIVVVLFFACVKCARLVVEVGMAAVHLPWIAVTDIASGQRVKEGIKYYISLYFTLFLCVALLGVYFVGFSFINTNIKGAFPAVLMHIALAWAIIDGPNILERIIGIDAGLKTGWQTIMGIRAAGSVAATAGKTAGKAVNSGAAIGKTAARMGRKAAEMSGRAVVGNKTMDAAAEKAANLRNQTKNQTKAAANAATGGHGLAGFMRNAADGLQAKTTPENSTAGLNLTAERNSDKGAISKMDTSQAKAGDQQGRPAGPNHAGPRKSVIPPYEPAQSRDQSVKNIKKGPSGVNTSGRTLAGQKPINPRKTIIPPTETTKTPSKGPLLDGKPMRKGGN